MEQISLGATGSANIKGDLRNWLANMNAKGAEFFRKTEGNYLRVY